MLNVRSTARTFSQLNLLDGTTVAEDMHPTFQRILLALQSDPNRTGETFRLAAVPQEGGRIPASVDVAFSCHLSAASYLALNL